MATKKQSKKKLNPSKKDIQKMTEKQIINLLYKTIDKNRVPLVGVLGYLSMLNLGDFGPLKKGQKRVIKGLVRTSKQMLVNHSNILTIYKLYKSTPKISQKKK